MEYPLTAAWLKSMAPPLVSGAPAPVLLPSVLTVWLAAVLVGLQSTTVTFELGVELAVALAGTDAIISRVVCARTVPVLSLLSRLLFATAVMMRSRPPGRAAAL